MNSPENNTYNNVAHVIRTKEFIFSVKINRFLTKNVSTFLIFELPCWEYYFSDDVLTLWLC